MVSQVAFAWDGEQQDNSDIYVKLVGSSEVRRLTTARCRRLRAAVVSRREVDSRTRGVSRSTSHRLRLMSPLGGSDRALSHFPAAAAGDLVPGRTVPGCGKSVRGLAPPTRATGSTWCRSTSASPGQLTQVVAPEHDGSPAFSPNGRHLAYASCRNRIRTNCHVQLLDLD